MDQELNTPKPEPEEPKKPIRTKKPQGKDIWIYSPHPRVTAQLMSRLLNNYSTQYDRLRLELGLKFNQFIIPVFPEVDKRPLTIQGLYDLNLDHGLLLIAGREEDKDDKEIQKLYSGQAVIYLPKERQFLIDTMSDPMSYKTALEKKDELLDYLGEYFEEIQIIR